MSNCDLVNDGNTRALCVAMASHNPSVCPVINNANDRQRLAMGELAMLPAG